MLSIAIDVTPFLASRTGVGVCVGELVKAMLAAHQDDRITLWALSAGRRSRMELCEAFPGSYHSVSVRRIPVRVVRSLTDKWGWPTVETLVGRYDVFHASHLLVPAGKTPTVVTVYDLTPIRFPEYHLLSNRFTLDQLKCWLDRVDLVVVNSRSTASDLQNFASVSEQKVRIVPLGVKSCFRPVAGNYSEVLAGLGLAKEYLLTVGSIEPRKNLERLFKAFRLLKDNHRIPHKLAVVGPPGWMNAAVYQTVRDLHLTADVVFTGFVDDHALNYLYNKAALLVYPSVYEGFGLPPLEAMAAGCPVAVSAVSSLPEVVGDAGVYFDPFEAEAIAHAIYQVLDSADLRRSLVEQGFVRSQGFSWQKAAEETWKVYEQAWQNRGNRRI